MSVSLRDWVNAQGSAPVIMTCRGFAPEMHEDAKLDVSQVSHCVFSVERTADKILSACVASIVCAQGKGSIRMRLAVQQR
jgi:hypothetical protein